MDGAGNGAAGKEAWPNVAQGQVRVLRTFLVFTSDAAKPVVASGVVVGFDRRSGVYHVRYDAIGFGGATIAIPDQGEPGVIVARGVAAHFAAATHHRGGFGRCGSCAQPALRRGTNVAMVECPGCAENTSCYCSVACMAAAAPRHVRSCEGLQSLLAQRGAVGAAPAVSLELALEQRFVAEAAGAAGAAEAAETAGAVMAAESVDVLELQPGCACGWCAAAAAAGAAGAGDVEMVEAEMGAEADAKAEMGAKRDPRAAIGSQVFGQKPHKLHKPQKRRTDAASAASAASAAPPASAASPASSSPASSAAAVAIVDAAYRLSDLVSRADAVVPGFERPASPGRSARSARAGRSARRADRADREDPVCVYVDGAWRVYALHVLVQYEATENDGTEEETRWESAHTYHGTRMWREFVSVRSEWADLAHEYKPEEAEKLAKDAAETLPDDEADAADATGAAGASEGFSDMPLLEPLEAARAARAARAASGIETEIAD